MNTLTKPNLTHPNFVSKIVNKLLNTYMIHNFVINILEATFQNIMATLALHSFNARN